MWLVWSTIYPLGCPQGEAMPHQVNRHLRESGVEHSFRLQAIHNTVSAACLQYRRTSSHRSALDFQIALHMRLARSADVAAVVLVSSGKSKRAESDSRESIRQQDLPRLSLAMRLAHALIEQLLFSSRPSRQMEVRWTLRVFIVSFTLSCAFQWRHPIKQAH